MSKTRSDKPRKRRVFIKLDDEQRRQHDREYRGRLIALGVIRPGSAA